MKEITFVSLKPDLPPVTSTLTKHFKGSFFFLVFSIAFAKSIESKECK